MGLKRGQTRPKIHGTVSTNRHTTIPNDSGPISACFDDDPKLVNCEIAQPRPTPFGGGYESRGCILTAGKKSAQMMYFMTRALGHKVAGFESVYRVGDVQSGFCAQAHPHRNADNETGRKPHGNHRKTI